MTGPVLQVPHLRAALRCAADQYAPRTYLNSVLVEFGPDFVNYVGTDGSALFVSQHETEVPLALVGQKAAIKRDAVKHLKGADEFHVEDLTATHLVGRARGKKVDAVVSLELVGEPYPDWQRVVPDKVNGELAQYDPDLVSAVLGAFAELLDLKHPYTHVHHNGGGAAVVTTICDYALAVVMPMRGKANEIAAVRKPLARALKPATKSRKPAPAPSPAPVEETCADLV